MCWPRPSRIAAASPPLPASPRHASVRQRSHTTAAALAALAGSVFGQQAAAFRRFTLNDGKTFYAVITGKTSSSVSFTLQNGRPLNQPIHPIR